MGESNPRLPVENLSSCAARRTGRSENLDASLRTTSLEQALFDIGELTTDPLIHDTIRSVMGTSLRSDQQ